MGIKFYYFIAVAYATVFSAVGTAFAGITPADIDGISNSELELNQDINQQPSIIITGGEERGENLFHVFEEFNVLTDEQVFFLNNDEFSRIFSITLGDSVSTVDGTLGIIGDGDLFFINSNGINFGPNAVLAIEGSFIGTTADAISFADGTTLSLENTEVTPLFSSSIPIGLGFSSQSASIVVENRGHNLAGSGILPYAEGLPRSGLSVPPENTLTLIAGEVLLDGGILRAPDGSLDLVAIEEGDVRLRTESNSLGFNPVTSSALGNISASKAALVDFSGVSGGAIRLTGQSISFTERAVALVTGAAGESDGGIKISSDSLYISGDTDYQFEIPSDPTVPAEVLPASIISQSVETSKE